MDAPPTLERTLVGDEEEQDDEVVLNHHNTVGNQQGEDIPFSNEFSNNVSQTPVVNRNTVMQIEEERPDTGMNMLIGINFCQSGFFFHSLILRRCDAEMQ